MLRVVLLLLPYASTLLYGCTALVSGMLSTPYVQRAASTGTASEVYSKTKMENRLVAVSRAQSCRISLYICLRCMTVLRTSLPRVSSRSHPMRHAALKLSPARSLVSGHRLHIYNESQHGDGCSQRTSITYAFIQPCMLRLRVSLLTRSMKTLTSSGCQPRTLVKGAMVKPSRPSRKLRQQNYARVNITDTDNRSFRD